MTLSELLNLIQLVVLSPEVIGVTAVVIAYIIIVNYVVAYRKRPAGQLKSRKKKGKGGDAAAADAEAAESRDDDSGDEDEVPPPRKRRT